MFLFTRASTVSVCSSIISQASSTMPYKNKRLNNVLWPGKKNESLRLWCISNGIFFMISLVFSLGIFLELKEIFKLKEMYAPINNYPNNHKLNRSKLLFDSQRCHIINPMDSSLLLGNLMLGPLEVIPPSTLYRHTHWGKRQLYCWLFNT